MENQFNNQSCSFGCLSVVFFVLSAVLPLVLLAIGWVGWDFETGLMAGLVAFAACFVTACLLTVGGRVPGWLAVILPAAVGLTYSAFDFIPLPVDDVLVASADLIVTITLAGIRYGGLPRQALTPLLGAALFTVIGDFIPTPIDNVLVNLLALGTATNGLMVGNVPPQLPGGQY